MSEDVTLEEIRKEFPNANYAPKKDCKFCGGCGTKSNHPGMPCICIFVDHWMCDWAAEALAETAKKIAKDLE